MNIKQQPTIDELLNQLQSLINSAVESELKRDLEQAVIQEHVRIRNAHKRDATEQWDKIHEWLGTIHKMYRTNDSYSDSPGYMASRLYKLLTFHEEGSKQQEKPNRRHMVEVDQ